MRSFGFSKATPKQFIISRLMNVVQMSLYYVPLILFGMVITINFQGYLALAFFFGSIVGKLYLLFVHPMLANRFERSQVEFPADKEELRKKIIELANEFDYPDPEKKIMLTQSLSGDLHSNAGVNVSHIVLSKQLLEHHEGKDDEILAILAHEFGHW